jgi:Leucine-rich repeat (LRR) protein
MHVADACHGNAKLYHSGARSKRHPQQHSHDAWPACSCTALERVAFHINELTSIPSTVGQLSRLQAGSWHRNRLTSLPPEIGNLSSLREFALFENQLTELPDTIGRLKSVTEFWVYDNLLEALPESIGDMASLRCAASCNLTCSAPAHFKDDVSNMPPGQ